MNETDVLLEQLRKQVSYKNQTSYSFYFLWSIVKLAESAQIIELSKISETMLALAWNDVSEYSDCFRQKDMLPRLKVAAMSELGLSEYEHWDDVVSSLSRAQTPLLNEIHKITWCVTYFFLDRKEWQKNWLGMAFYEKMQKLAFISQTDNSCLYLINKNSIEIRYEYLVTIRQNQELFEKMIKEQVRSYFEKRRQ